MAVSAVKKETAKPAEGAPAQAAPAPAKKRKWLWLVIGLLLLSAAGGGAWWYLHKKHDDAAPAEVKPVATKPPVFAPLDLFTVNLQAEETPQFLQVGLTLQVTDETVVESLKQHTPEIRDRVLLLLSAKKPSELLTVDGKRKLSEELCAAINGILVPVPTPPAAAETAPAPATVADTAPTAATAPDGAAPAAVAPTTTPAEPPPSASQPVQTVLFTSFIVQ